MSGTYDSDADDGPDSDGADDETELAEAKESFQRSEEAWDANRRASLEDMRFARDEDQWPAEIRRQRELDGRPCLTLNQLRVLILQVINDARQNKPGIDVKPVGSGADQRTADALNGLIRQIQRTSDAVVAFDSSIDNAVSGGFGFFRVNTRYADDDTFDQDLVIERIADPHSVYPDPDDMGADSANWNVCWVLCPISKKAWEKRWPDKDPVSFDGDAPVSAERSGETMLQYGECWTRESVARTIVALTPVPDAALGGDPAQIAQAQQLVNLTGAWTVVGLDVYEKHKDLFDALGMTEQGRRDVPSHKVTQTLWSGAEKLETVEWVGTYIPIIPVWGEEIIIKGVRKFRSLIRGAKDGQRMYNYWETTATELVALAPKTPFIGRKGAFETDAAKWATANSETHAYIEYDGQEAPQRQPYASVPGGAITQANRAQQNIMSIVGIFKSSIGAQSNETSGVAIDARDKQADTGSFHFTDNQSRAIEHAGRVLIDLIPKVYSTPRLIHTLDPDGSVTQVAINQPQPVVDPKTGQPVQAPNPETGLLTDVMHTLDLTAGKYDVTVKAGPNYATVREEFAKMITEIIRVYPESAPVLADLLIKNYDVPDADEIVARLEQLGQNNPQLSQAKQIIQKGEQTIAGLQLQVRELQGKRDGYTRENEIRAYDAETDRLKVIVGGNGAQADPAAMAQVVMHSLMTIMNSPDILEGMAGGQDPQQMAAMLAQRMQPQPDDGLSGAPPAPAPAPMSPPLAA